jgi:formate dehydrogenase subunit delta
MDRERLVAMANDIAAFFDSEADKAVAAEGVRFHLTRFWDPRMRREIVAHLQDGGAGLCATAKSAVALLGNSPNQSP